MTMKYNNYLRFLSEKFERRLEELFPDYNFDYGDEFEVAICEILRNFLPSKYGICRGFVVNSIGQKAGDDIIIYDRERFPTLRLLGETYSRKENIPIEAVYAYIEAKHTLDEKTILKSFNQISEVKKVLDTRVKIGLEQIDNYLTLENFKKVSIDDYPNYRNPFYTMIIGRRCNNELKSIEKKEIYQFLKDKIPEDANLNSPDFIVAGKYHFIGVGIENNSSINPIVFIHPEKKSKYFLKQSDISFGMSLAILFQAIDWIKLGPMPWDEMINEVIE